MSGNSAEMKAATPDSYLVAWMLDVDTVNNPTQAATKALFTLVNGDVELFERLTSPDSLAHWTVYDHKGTRVDIDLAARIENRDALSRAWAEVPDEYVPDDDHDHDLAVVIAAMARDLRARSFNWQQIAESRPNHHPSTSSPRYPTTPPF